MPITESNYNPPYFFRNGHLSTIYPNLIRKVTGVDQTRERVELDDGDFIDIDWSYTSKLKSGQRVAILIHGLEGNAQRQYIMGLAKNLNLNNWDVAAINLRNCSGEVNRLYRSYNAGVSDDLSSIVDYIITKDYGSISICGFSLGGNITLKYLGERKTPLQVKSAVAVSVPCDLYDSLCAINKPSNFIYQQRFIRSLKQKLLERQHAFPDKISISDIKACKSLIDIDDLYTSKAHGYIDALDYYKKCSSKQFLKEIKTPTLIINAKNDSFLGDACYPIEEAKENSNLFLETPDFGGHVGFYLFGDTYYNEQKTVAFLQK
ncbi:YheT family hydrolase [Aquimarina sp. 2201CG14-23]|uniref:YheT family hydrolase n=1 Tax=Aquimarina mycalae TaxID=3040073 RepID=UPI002477D909|nr:alpha/beta fold hydrolase [Aquimarina sp. 2201CG14-23]MDH7447364.1 alpha/beta fold hydrolase [Aquimarina sp. 2201CG14-23]